MAKPKREFVDGPFGQIHIRRSDADVRTGNLPLICLHQSPKSSREFAKLMNAYSNDRTLIGIDSPGHGESDLLEEIDQATIENYAKSAWAAIDALGIDRVDLLGHHTGSKVATEMAYQQSDRVREIVMISALVLSREEIAYFESMFQTIELDDAGTRFQDMWAKSIEHRGNGVSLQDLADSFAENLRAGDAYEWGHKAAFEYAPLFPERVKTLPHKITVLNPGDMLFEMTPRVAPLLQNGEVINYQEWGFGFMDAYPEDAAAAVEKALS